MNVNGAAAGKASPGSVVMAALHPSVRSPLPKITPLLVDAIRKSGWMVETTWWGGRIPDESWGTKVMSRGWELAKALSKLRARPGSILFVNSAPSAKGIARDLPLALGARLLGHSSLILWHGSDPNEVVARPRSALAVGCRLLVMATDGILVLSSYELRGWQHCFPRGRFFVVSNPYVSKMPARSRQVHRPASLLFVGRVMKSKGVFVVLEAFKKLSASHDCALSIVGDGPDKAAVTIWVERETPGRVRLPGYLDDQGLREEYGGADVFVLPTSHSEGFPTVVSEAMDAGLPIVTTRRGATPDHLQEGVNCLFVPERDPAALESTIAKLLDDPDLRAAMGAANRRKIQEFAPDEVVRGYLRALEAVRARREARRRR